MGANRHHRREALHCCPACAASVLGRPGPRARSRPAWTWVTLLGIVAALVPLAAMDGNGGPAVAQAAPIEAADTQRLAPSPPIAEDIPTAPTPPPTPKRPAVRWRDSLAVGTPNDGRLEKAVRLPAEGRGYYTYNPATQAPPGGADRTWGTAALVREILDLGGWWARTHPSQPPLGIGDLSREHGGPFTGPDVGHQSHQNGLDVDIRLVRRDGARASVGPDTYDRERTQEVVDRLVARGATLVLIGPNLDLRGPSGVVIRWPAHDDHLHVRVADPDGSGN